MSAVQVGDVISQMEEWIERRQLGRYVAVTGMHGIMEAHHDPAFRGILNSASLVVPDGMPLVWLARLKGHNLKRRVYGPELMMAFCERSAPQGCRHFLYGGGPGVVDKLAAELANRFPGLVIAGTYSPPFRALTEEEDEWVVQRINQASPDVLWIGLSTPKQERWMRDHSGRLRVPAMLGVGAAFDIHSGSKRQAPVWMREHGLEWFFRLLQEPRRLWRRYVLYGSEFIFWVTLDLLGFYRSE